MATKTAFASRSLTRSMAMGVLSSMLFFYGAHVLGKWTVENYRPHSQTTFTVLLHNTCAVFGNTHTLRPNTNISAIGNGIDTTKLTGSFMNFTDGHVVAMVILSLLAGGALFAIRKSTSSFVTLENEQRQFK